jgi:hypothetical protein
VLLRQATLAGIAAGEIDLVFRRWRRPTVKAGGRLRTAIGELGIDAVDRVTPTRITAAEARRAGHESRADLLAFLDSRTEGNVYRVRVHLAGPDQRVALREQTDLTDADVEAIDARLDRLDRASKRGAWTRSTLRMIEEKPATRAPDLAASVGRETQAFKTDVRKLKELGLTESLEVGYRLSPRGRAYLERTDS